MLVTVIMAVATTVFNAGIAWGLFRSMREKMEKFERKLEEHLPSIVILSQAVSGIKEVLEELKDSLYVSFQGRMNYLETKVSRLEGICEERHGKGKPHD
jgi:hypothetical protein